MKQSDGCFFVFVFTLEITSLLLVEEHEFIYHHYCVEELVFMLRREREMATNCVRNVNGPTRQRQATAPKYIHTYKYLYVYI